MAIRIQNLYRFWITAWVFPGLSNGTVEIRISPQVSQKRFSLSKSIAVLRKACESDDSMYLRHMKSRASCRAENSLSDDVSRCVSKVKIILQPTTERGGRTISTATVCSSSTCTDKALHLRHSPSENCMIYLFRENQWSVVNSYLLVNIYLFTGK